jgi:hypothetical protein
MSDTYNIDLANRQVEINEWTYNNKMDSLFVLQLTFIALVFVGILMILKGQGVVPASFVWYSMGVLLFIVVVIIINRSVYTNTRRDTRYWNRKRFPGDNTMKSPLGLGDTSYLSYMDTVRGAYGSDVPDSRC